MGTLEKMLMPFQNIEERLEEPGLIDIECKENIECVRVWSEDATEKLAKLERVLEISPILKLEVVGGSFHFYDFNSSIVLDMSYDDDIHFG